MSKKFQSALYIAIGYVLSSPLYAAAQLTGYQNPDNSGNRTQLRAGGADYRRGLGFYEVLLNILNFVMGLVSVLSILMIVVAGIMYMTSGGDQGRVDTAKKWLTYAIVGLIISLSGFVIVATISAALDTN